MNTEDYLQAMVFCATEKEREKKLKRFECMSGKEREREEGEKKLKKV